MEVKVGDFVTLDYENKNNRLYHEEKENLYSIRPNKVYEVVEFSQSVHGPLVTIEYETLDAKIFRYTCFARRVRLVESPNEKVVLWK